MELLIRSITRNDTGCQEFTNEDNKGIHIKRLILIR